MLGRCEGVRRRETERFRDVSAQTSTLLQELATSVGCSDDRWASPPCAVRRTPPAARESGKFKRAPLQSPHPSPSPPPPPPSVSSRATPSGTQRWSQPAPVGEGTPRLPVGIARVAVEPDSGMGAVSRTPDDETREARATEPAGLDGAGLGRARAGARDEGSPADIGKGSPSSPIGGGLATENHEAVHARGRCGMEQDAQGGGSVQRRQIVRTEGPGVHPGAAEAPFSSEEASLSTGQATTMASAATFLLARTEVKKRDPSTRLPASRVYPEEEGAVAREAGGHELSPRMQHALKVSLSGRGRVEEETERQGPALSEAREEGKSEGGSRGVTVEDERQRAVGAAHPSPSGPTGLTGRSGMQETVPVTRLTREGGGASGSPQSVGTKARSVGEPPEALPSPSRRQHDGNSPAQTRSAWAERPGAATADVEEPIASADWGSTYPMLSAPIGDCSPAAARKRDVRRGDTGRDVSDTGSAKGGTGVAEGEDRSGADGGGERRQSEDATGHLLREALQVKGLLATMDRADASTGDDGLRDEDPGRFLAGLGLVELKPLAGRLAEALERSPQASLGDPAVAVSEPRTARGLRDQVVGARVCCGCCFGLRSSSGDEFMIRRKSVVPGVGLLVGRQL